MARTHWPERRVALPGGWLLGDTPANGDRCAAVVMRPLTGREEEWLANNRGAPSAIAATQILDACVLCGDDGSRPRDMARRMLVGDRDYLMLQLRRLMLGDKILAIMVCRACGAKMDVQVDASEISVEGPTPRDMAGEVELPARDAACGRTIRFRLPTGGDQEAVVGRPIDAAADEILARCLLDSDAPALTTEEKTAVIDAIEAQAPRVEVEFDLQCPECAASFVSPFDPTTFFLDEMRISAAQLTREVHTLAFYYHWSEADILSLTRDRRRSYLALLSETLRPE
jgi:hypothetical protein